MEQSSLELFAGTGGLAMGMHAAGIRAHTVVEWDGAVIESFIRQRDHFGAPEVIVDDVNNVDFEAMPRTDVVTGGPPCQPFSNGGKHRGHLDRRDMFPHAIRSVATLAPKAFVFENVRGLLRPAFSDYVEEILERLRAPLGDGGDLSYDVQLGLLNAADFGVPQNRYRAFFVGVRRDLGIGASLPQPTHNKNDLRAAKATGSYWRSHGMDPPPGQKLPIHAQTSFEESRWQTTRDALAGLPDPVAGPTEKFTNHEHRPGAREYPGHTGSYLDEPSKTIKAGVHGVPGGENMVRLDNGGVRYFTVREAARVQSFPDWYHFEGAWSIAMRQIGNAVPPRLATAVGSHVQDLLAGGTLERARHAEQVPLVGHRVA